MPEWIHAIGIVNPIEYAVTAVRSILAVEPDFSGFATGFSVTLLFAGVTLYWAISAFKSYKD